jgi:hypothetical protein
VLPSLESGALAPASLRHGRTRTQNPPIPFDNTSARLPEVFHAKLNPTPFSEEPYLLVFNIAAAALICAGGGHWKSEDDLILQRSSRFGPSTVPFDHEG